MRRGFNDSFERCPNDTSSNFFRYRPEKRVDARIHLGYIANAVRVRGTADRAVPLVLALVS